MVFAAILYALIQAYSLLAPVLLSFLLIVLITLAVNPVVSRIRTWAVGRKRATGLGLFGVLMLGGLAAWSAVGPMKQSVATLSESLPDYWERLQKALIKLEQKAEISEEKMQEEVSEEIAREAPETGEAGPARRPLESTRPPGAPSKSENEDGESLRSGLAGMLQKVF